MKQQLAPITSNMDYSLRGGNVMEMAYDYYKLPSTKYSLAKGMNHRETVLLKEGMDGAIRPLAISLPSSKYINWMLEFFNFRRDALDYKIYSSVFKIDWNLTGFPPKDLKNLADFRKGFNKKFSEAKLEADFIMDIDPDKKAIEQGKSSPEEEFVKTRGWACQLHEHLMNQKIPHLINFSGTGFNARIPTEFLPPWQDWYHKAKDLAELFATQSHIPFNKDAGVDLGVYDERRIFKVLYSLANGKVVLPVNTQELWDYSLEDYDFLVAFRNQHGFYNHYTEHPKAPNEFFMKTGVVYDYGEQGKKNLEKILDGI